MRPTLPPSAALAYLHLYRLSFGHNRRQCRVSVAKLGERCNIGKTALTAALVQLERRGLVPRIGTEYGGKNLNARGAEWLFALPPGTLSDFETVPESGSVPDSGRIATARSPYAVGTVRHDKPAKELPKSMGS